MVVSRQMDLSVGSVLGLSAYVSFQPLRAGARDPHPSGLSRRHRDRCGMRRGQRRHHRPRPGTGPGRHAGHHLHHLEVSTSRSSWRKRWSQLVAGPLLAIGSDLVVGIPLRHHVLAVCHSGRRLLPPLVPVGTRALRHRSNPDAARLVGNSDRAARSSAPTWPAAPSPGLAGSFGRPTTGRSDSTAGTGYELTVVTAVVVGGVAIFRR